MLDTIRPLPHAAKELPSLLRHMGEQLPDPDAYEDFGARFDRFTDATVVMLGEATHGTSEFCRARAAITRRLIEQHGFTIVAAEADRPNAARIDHYGRDRGPARDADPVFQRFPTWMWRNEEVCAFSNGCACSYENAFRHAGWARSLTEWRDPRRRKLGDRLREPLERAIGVVYRPQSELRSHYFPADRRLGDDQVRLQADVGGAWPGRAG